MLTTAMKALYALLKAAWPSGALLLDPDAKTDADTFEAALEANAVVVRYWQPQPLTADGGLMRHTAFVDVCSRSAATAAIEADKLLAFVQTHARSPNGATNPRAVPIREASYQRMHVTFTLIADAIEEQEES